MTDPDPLPPELLDGYHRFRSGRFAEEPLGLRHVAL